MQGSLASVRRVLRRARVGVVVALLASTAAAQDYTVTSQSGQYVTPPTTGTTDVLPSIGNKDDGTYTITSLPFDIPYFGVGIDKITVCTNGYCYMNAVGNYVYGYSPIGLPASGTYDGIVKVAMTDGDGQGGNSKLLYWTDGTAPNRRFIITWLNWQHYYITGSATFQAQFYETGRIQLAYTSNWNWPYSTGVGIDAISPDSRWAAPNNSSNYTFSGTPQNDWRFEPDITKVSGSASIASVVSDGSGFGNSSASPRPAGGLRAELQASGSTNAAGYLDANGEFEIQGAALNSSTTGSVVLVSEGLGCRVSASTPDNAVKPYASTMKTPVSYGNDSDIGDFVLDDSNDSAGTGRAPLQIAAEIEAIRNFVQTATGTTIPLIDVFYDPNNGSPTRYTPAGSLTPPYIRIAGPGTSNPDAFDGSVVARVYMRHVLATLTGSAPTSYSQSLDTVTDQAGAFADALGLYAHAYVSGESVAYDGTSTSSTVSVNLETPTLSRARGPAVGGWAAAALYDLLDGANETHDAFDGSSNPGRVFTAVDAVTGEVNASTFLTAWANQGYDADELVAIFIHYGLLPDDAKESNDTFLTAQALGTTGLRATGLVLNRFNEDWYSFVVADTSSLFFVEMVYDRFSTAATVEMQVFASTGALVATGVPEGTTGPIRATLSNLPTGQYVVRIAHTGGSTISNYELQAYAQMSLALSSAPAWTVGKRIQEPLALFGGIPPYTIVAKDSTGQPFSAIQFIASQTTAPFDMVWTPRDVGTFVIQISATDSGSPTHSRTLNLNFRVNAELSFSAPALTGVALSKSADVNLGRVGGTDPIALEDQFGNLPGGLSLDPDFHIRGTASEPGGGGFGFRATDVAGSEAVVDSFLVVCVPIETKKQAVPLAAGQSAAGFYFDALQGSLCSMSLKTAKKRAKRDLDFLVIGPDGNVVQGGNARIRAGSVRISGLALPTTGRYFMAFASDDGGADTELQGTLSLALPKKDGGVFEQMELSGLYKIEFGALAGADLSIKGKTTDGMEIRVLFLIKPDGEILPFGAVTVANGNGRVTIRADDLPQDGTYQLYVQPQKTDLADFAYKLKLRQPKGGSFSIDD